MLQFHAHVFGRPAFAVSFEETQTRLMRLPRLDTEPDGYFLIAGGESEGNRWNVNGQLFELGDRLHRVELHGACPEETLNSLLECFGWPEDQIVFELVREGITLDEANFRKWAAQAK